MKTLQILLIACSLISVSAGANDLKIPVPENAQTAWISDSINQDGMQLAIQTFHSDDSVENILDFYREAWFKDGDIPGFIENELGDWSVISQLRDDSNVVLQVKTNDMGRTQGFLSTATKYPRAERPDLDFPLLDGTERFSSSYVEENDAQVHTMTFLSTQSVGNTVSFYRKSMVGKGWKIARDKEVEGNQIMLFNNRNGDRCELVISQLNSEATVIHVNRVIRNG